MNIAAGPPNMTNLHPTVRMKAPATKKSASTSRADLPRTPCKTQVPGLGFAIRTRPSEQCLHGCGQAYPLTQSSTLPPSIPDIYQKVDPDCCKSKQPPLMEYLGEPRTSKLL